MEKVTTAWEELLQRYVDNDLDTTEQKKVAFEIEKSVALQNRFVELKAIHELLTRNAKLEMPAKNFTEKVMKGLSVRYTYSFLSPRNGLLLLIAIISMCSIGFILLSAGAFDAFNLPLTLDTHVLKSVKINLPTLTVPLNGKWIMQTFLFLNCAVAFVLLDRTILRPYFQRRASMLSANS